MRRRPARGRLGLRLIAAVASVGLSRDGAASQMYMCMDNAHVEDNVTSHMHYVCLVLRVDASALEMRYKISCTRISSRVIPFILVRFMRH
jgi:hypothetical protein